MTSENLQRTSYRDPNTPDDRVRSGTTTLAENEQDMDQYYRPLERIHGSSLHGWGVASGLSVTATLNSATLTVQPGVALDRSGQHIALAVGGNAEVGPTPTGFSTGATFVPVTASGVAMPTTNLTGDKYLTIQFLETFDSDSYNNLGIFRYFHTPWLRLLDVAGFANDGSQVVLAKVSFAASPNVGQVTALTQELRQATDLPVGSIHLQREVQSTAAGNVVVAMVEAGAIRASAAGRLAITVPNATDEIHLERDDGTNFAKVSLGAEKVVARQGNGVESVVIDSEVGSITASGDVTASNATVSGSINASSITASGDVTVSGSINASSITASGGVTASSATVSGSINASSITTSGGVTATSATVNGPISASSGISSSTSTFGAPGITGVGGPGSEIILPGKSVISPGTGVIGIGGSTFLFPGHVFRGHAGDFQGDVAVNGNLSKSGGGFKIDHPLDPANKYLSHSFVESSEMKNIYDGVAVLDDHGEAVVELPVWVEALNIEFRYQLTCIGGYAPVYIAEKVHDNRFKIAGGEPEMEVSWLMTGIRRDAWANAHRLSVEEDKPAEEQGYYLHPELHGASSKQHVFVVHHPETAALLTLPEQGTQEES